MKNLNLIYIALLLISFSSMIISMKGKMKTETNTHSKTHSKTQAKSNSKTQAKTQTRGEQDLRNSAQAFLPYVYTHSSETFFPVSLENMSINWVSDLTDSSSNITFNYNAGKTLDNSAPVYTKIQTTSSGGFLYTYAYLFAYNSCGPKGNVKAKATAVVSLSINENITLCPAGVHNGDIERVQVLVDGSLNFKSITLGYHSNSKTYTSGDIGWENGHPVVYMAKGSHAMYPSSGDQHYMYYWSINKTTSGPCGVKTCKKWGVPYPCGIKYCDYGFTSSGSFFDSTAKNNKFTGTLRIIAASSFTVSTSTLTSNEQKILVYQGRFGATTLNSGFATFEDVVNTTLSPLYAICSSCKTTVKNGLDTAASESEYKGMGPESLATKWWWKNEGI